MLKGNKKGGFFLGLFIMGLLLCSYTSLQFPPRLLKKVDSAVKTTYGVETYDLNPVVVSKEVNESTKAELDGDHLFEVLANGERIGYIYVGQTPSMKNVFDYIVLFNTDLTIKKSKVLIYRENYGLQIGSQRWLKQFIGLSIDDELVYGENIDGIAGATISASSMTKATNNVLGTLKMLKEKELL